jgi:hypothetical protein
MSRIAFLTRLFVFSQAPLPSRSIVGRNLQLVPTLIAEDHQLARGAAHLERFQPEEATDPVLLVDHQVANLEVAEV